MCFRKIIFIMFTFLFLTEMWCQNISGIVTDETLGNALANAHVFLFSAKDSVPFNMMATDSVGYFAFKNITIKDSITLTVMHLGYSAYNQNITEFDQFPLLIKLKQSAIELSDVTVAATRPLFKMQDGILNVQVENSVLSEVGTFSQLINYIPFVNSQNNEIQMFGKDKILFYINNRLEKDHNKVFGINAKDIQSIELIMSPGAEYDVSADVVIKIFLKSKQGNGLSGDFDALFATGIRLNGYLQLNLNYRKNNTDIFGHLRSQSYNLKSVSHTETEISNHLENYLFISDYTSNRFSDDYRWWVGFNTVFDKNSSIGARFQIVNISKYQLKTNYKVEQYLNSVYDSDYLLDSDTNIKNNRGLYGNFYYNGQWWNNLSLSCNLDYENHTSDRMLIFKEIYEEKQSNTQSETSQNFDIYSGKIKFDYPVYKGKVSVGSDYARTDYFLRFISDYTNLYEDGIENSSLQHLFAGFLNLQFPVEKFLLEGGVRYEGVKYDYFINKEKQRDMSQNYGDFFPFMSLAYNGNEINMNLSYRGGIFRPNYYQLRTTTEYVSLFEYASGNPFLQPTMRHVINASFAYKKLFFITNYSYYKNLTVSYIEQYNNLPAIIRTILNVPKYETLSTSASWNTTIKKWNLFTECGITFPLSKLEINGNLYNFRQPKYYLSLNNIFSLPYEFKMLLNLSYYSGGHQNIYLYDPSGYLQVGFSKEILKNLETNVWFTDCLKTDRNKYTYNISNITQTNNTYNGAQMIMFSLRYSFNSAESRYKSSRSGIEERQRLNDF